MSDHIYEPREDGAEYLTSSGFGVPCRWCGRIADNHSVDISESTRVSGAAPIVEGAALTTSEDTSPTQPVVEVKLSAEGVVTEPEGNVVEPKRKPAAKKPTAKAAKAQKK